MVFRLIQHRPAAALRLALQRYFTSSCGGAPGRRSRRQRFASHGGRDARRWIEVDMLKVRRPSVGNSQGQEQENSELLASIVSYVRRTWKCRRPSNGSVEESLRSSEEGLPVKCFQQAAARHVCLGRGCGGWSWRKQGFRDRAVSR